MKTKIPVGILGATGMVGQQYIHLLADHPWFRVAYVAASPQSAGKKYKDALKSGWIVGGEMPTDVAELIVHDVADAGKAKDECAFVFSAFEMPDKDAIRAAITAFNQFNQQEKKEKPFGIKLILSFLNQPPKQPASSMLPPPPRQPSLKRFRQ